MVIWISLIVLVAGLLCYAFASNPKVSELGRLAFFAGLFVALLHLHDLVAVAR